MWASTHDGNLNKKMSALVAGLSACQEKIGTGYLSAFPSEFFDRFEAVKPVWAPYYTIHTVDSVVAFDYAIIFGFSILGFQLLTFDRSWLGCWINIP